MDCEGAGSDGTQRRGRARLLRPATAYMITATPGDERDRITVASANARNEQRRRESAAEDDGHLELLRNDQADKQ